MTIKPIKSESSEPEGNQQHRECLNKSSSPKSPVSIAQYFQEISLVSVFGSLTWHFHCSHHNMVSNSETVYATPAMGWTKLWSIAIGAQIKNRMSNFKCVFLFQDENKVALIVLFSVVHHTVAQAILKSIINSAWWISVAVAQMLHVPVNRETRTPMKKPPAIAQIQWLEIRCQPYSQIHR